MAKFTAPSGAKVEVTLSDYSTAWDLLKAVLKATRNGGMGTKLPDSMNFELLKTMEIKNLGGLMDAAIDVMTSKEVEDLLFKCMEKATYNDSRITRSTFEDEIARGDFLAVAWEVGKLNVSPFMTNLLSGLKDITQGSQEISQA